MKFKQAREPIATWFQLTRYRVVIEPVKVVAFTDKTVTILTHREERQNLHSEYYDYYPTWDEAHAALLGRWEQKKANAESSLQDAIYKVEQVRLMKQSEAA